MYTNFFSLSELPFSIAPDPKYLFMSDRHREALTHLMYGLGDDSIGSNGGFVLLTGEVGTGKTTMSRCLMADLPDNTQLAFILNPTLSSHELLATICDQLKIRYRKTGATLKTITDKISEKLLKNHTDGINTLLIIDEAQHLDPQVLEQLRLLTNLETDTKKLLQVILIGQPELQQLLKRRDLRQLAQRITARYHLLPLDKAELALYIKHRLSVADCHRELFNKKALATIHHLSQGIPRVINLICHSALVEAYNSNNAIVDKNIVLKAANKALGDDFEQENWWQNRNLQIGLAASLLVLVLGTGYWLGQAQQAIIVNDEKYELLPKVESKQEILTEQSKAVVTEAAKELAEEIAKEVVKKIESEKLPQKKQAKQIIVSGDIQDKTQQNVIEELVIEPLNPPVKRIIQEPVASVPKVISELKSNKTSNSKHSHYQVEAVDGVSDDLLALFQAAIEETHDKPISTERTEVSNNTEAEIRPLTHMPEWVQNGVPNLQVEQHIYASNGQGWVNVNGRDRYEGDMITPELQLSEILPQKIILIYRDEKFSLPALTNW